MRKRHYIGIFFSVLVGFGVCCTGCVRMYSLPDAPPQSEWQVVDDPTKESEETRVLKFLNSKRSAIQCYAALADKRYDDAKEWLSKATIAYFEAHSGGEGLEKAFENGHLVIDGEEQPFDPVEDVFIGELVDIRDYFGSRTDDEPPGRTVLYAVSASGKARELVFIYEDDTWRLDCPHAPKDLLTE